MRENWKKVGTAPHHELFVGEAEDILIVIPEVGFRDTPDISRQTVQAMRGYAEKVGKRIAIIVAIGNLTAQDAESRRVYAEGVTPDLFYGIALVVTSMVARIIGNLALHLKSLRVPISMVESIDAGIAKLGGMRKAA
ncbi:MAG TPA: hypothetical protein PKE31_17525 [Pseudomonadota bacterium]|jgi:hypothetical protein|nr:hypothetical protein [Pseudomonadota bacterium]